jgi:hypothetical protein
VEPGFQKTKVTEDSPVWDCHTMGNKICGSGELHAEEDAIKFLSSLSDWCAARDQAAETWVEKHDGWFEVLGRCDGAYRSGS